MQIFYVATASLSTCLNAGGKLDGSLSYYWLRMAAYIFWQFSIAIGMPKVSVVGSQELDGGCHDSALDQGLSILWLQDVFNPWIWIWLHCTSGLFYMFYIYWNVYWVNFGFILPHFTLSKCALPRCSSYRGFCFSLRGSANTVSGWSDILKKTNEHRRTSKNIRKI